MSEQSKKVALPAYLPRRLEAFRIAKDGGHSYLIRDKLLGKTHDFEPWQFFVLEVLPGCQDYAKLASVFHDRFGNDLSPDQVRALFALLADQKLLDDDAARHPLLAPYLTKHYSTEDGQPKVKSFQGVPGAAAESQPAPAPPISAAAHAGAGVGAAEPELAPDATLPAGIQDAYGLDRRTTKRMWVLFDPRPMLKAVVPLVRPAHHLIYLLPLLLLASLWICGRYPEVVYKDVRRLHDATTLLQHVVFSMFTINLTATFVIAAVAHWYRGTVKAIGISIFMAFLPRFVARVDHAEQMTRREKLWLHATPLLTRGFLFSLGMLIWYNNRDAYGVLPKMAIAVAMLTALDVLFVSGNPLVKGSCYQLLSTFMNEPHLRGKAYKALVGRLKGDTFKEAEDNLLVGYALATVVYSYVLIAVAVYMVGMFFGGLQIGGAAVLLALVFGVVLINGTIKRFRLISEAYDRAERFERWRRRAVPEAAGEKPEEPKASRGFWSYARIAGLVVLVFLLFLPYPYEPGGAIKIFPGRQEMLTTDVPGLVEAVYFDGGEKVAKGTVIARLSTIDLKSQLATAEAKVAEQAAVVADLKARPKPEEVALAQRELEVAQKHLEYSDARVPRYEKLYADKVIAFDELDAARRTRDIDARQVEQKKAALDLARTGATKDHIAAAQAKLEALEEDRDAIGKKIDRTVLRMPFDGNVLTLHLKQKTNTYLERGAMFAAVENVEFVTAEIEVPEPESAYVKVGSPIRARPNPFSEMEFEGTVTVIDRNVTVQPFGNVIKVIATIRNKDDMLRNGMSGYAKVGGQTMPVWKAFTLTLMRFFNVQVWSWIP